MCLYTSDRRRLIDGLASWWTACHGYNHPHLIDAIRRQVESMSHVMFGGINHQPALDLARRLAEKLPGDLSRVFFSDSGSVAVEVAMKMAIQFHRNGGHGRRTRFVSFANAYHGDTTGAMSLCDPQRSMHSAYGAGILSQFSRDLPTNQQQLTEFDRFLGENRDVIAGVFIEPFVQGAGGMRFHSAWTLRSIADCCRKHGILLIADELATGFGRTGSLFAIDQITDTDTDTDTDTGQGQMDGRPPVDIVCVGKALTGGMIGMAATVASSRVFEAFWSDDPSNALMHGPTFMANPLACAAANASLDLFETEPRLEQVARIESQLNEQLAPAENFDRVIDVRVRGAIGVIQVDGLDHVDRLRQHFIDRGIWLRPFGDCIYTTPPLVISESELEQVCSAMVDITELWSRW